MKILDLPLKKKWYEMIESGVKREEYREYNDYWYKRLIDQDTLRLKPYTHVRFRYGYTKRTMILKIDSITIGVGNPDWGAPEYPVFIIKFHKENYIKQYTDLKQSRTLAKILSHDTADQTWERIVIAGANLGILEEKQYRHNSDMPFYFYSGIGVPCWSLAALLDVLPEGVIKNYYVPNIQKENRKYSIAYGNEELLCIANNPIDACYEMILKLNEMKLL